MTVRISMNIFHMDESTLISWFQRVAAHVWQIPLMTVKRMAICLFANMNQFFPHLHWQELSDVSLDLI